MEADLDKLAPIGPLTEWLDAHVPELGKGPLKTSLLSGGTSNVVLTLDRGEKPMVMRRPPEVRAAPDDDLERERTKRLKWRPVEGRREHRRARARWCATRGT